MLKRLHVFKIRRNFRRVEMRLKKEEICGKTLQLLGISRFHFSFHHDYTRDYSIFDSSFDLIFTEPPPPEFRKRVQGQVVGHFIVAKLRAG